MQVFRVHDFAGNVIFQHKCRKMCECIAAAKAARISLDYADFTRASLMQCDFRRMRLHRACFDYADIRYALFTGATLTSASMLFTSAAGARFRSADVSGVYAAGANFLDADLRNAILRTANLERAYFANAQLERAQFGEAETHEAELVLCRNRSYGQFSADQLVHYRDNLYALLCAAPPLAAPLLRMVSAVLRAEEPVERLARPRLLFDALCPQLAGVWDQFMLRVPNRFTYAESWFEQFTGHAIWERELLEMTRGWLEEWYEDSPRRRRGTRLQNQRQPNMVAGASAPAVRKLRLP